MKHYWLCEWVLDVCWSFSAGRVGKSNFPFTDACSLPHNKFVLMLEVIIFRFAFMSLYTFTQHSTAHHIDRYTSFYRACTNKKRKKTFARVNGNGTQMKKDNITYKISFKSVNSLLWQAYTNCVYTNRDIICVTMWARARMCAFMKTLKIVMYECWIAQYEFTNGFLLLLLPFLLAFFLHFTLYKCDWNCHWF